MNVVSWDHKHRILFLHLVVDHYLSYLSDINNTINVYSSVFKML